MAYSDYGAFVYCNEKRRTDKEDVAVYASDIDTFGDNIENIPSGARIWMHLLHEKVKEETPDYPDKGWIEYIHHGIMGDGQMRVVCHKQGLPGIFYWPEDAKYPERIVIPETDNDDFDRWGDYDIEYQSHGYRFHFISGRPYHAEMIEPDGTYWTCDYDYLYGAGFEED